jgi:Mg2+-importing ATPase
MNTTKNEAVPKSISAKTSIFADHPGLVAAAHANGEAALASLGSSISGLDAEEATLRLDKYGPNVIAKDKRRSNLRRLLEDFKNPLVILLTILGLISYFSGDLRSTVVIFIMVVLGVVLKYFQESKADDAAEKLQAMVSTTATVIREGKRSEIALKELVPGDMIVLGAGDMVPADVRVITCKDLFLNQASLTGESLLIRLTLCNLKTCAFSDPMSKAVPP